MRLRFIFLLLLLLGMTARGGTPAFKNGTLGLIPTNMLYSNFANSGSVTFQMGQDGIVSATAIGATGSNNIANYNGIGTNLTIYSNLVIVGSASNALIYVTNECSVGSFDDTNTLYASGAGTAAANGKYVIKSRVGDVYVWTNTVGAVAIKHDPAAFPTTLELTNATGILYSEISGDPEATWSTQLGDAPEPTVVYGTNFVTNCFSYVVSLLPILDAIGDSNLYVNPYLGSDSTGFPKRGRKDRSWATISNAVLAARAYETVVLSEGVHSMSTTVVFTNLSIRGSGRGITIVTNVTGDNPSFDMGANTVLADMTLRRVSVAPGLIGEVRSNIFMLNLDSYGNVDGLLLNRWDGEVTAVGCKFGSAVDGIANFATTTSGVLRLFNCEIEVTNTTASTSIRGIIWGGPNRCEMYGGVIRVKNGSSTTAGVVLDSANGKGHVHLQGVGFEFSNTNANGAFAVSNLVGGTSTITIDAQQSVVEAVNLVADNQVVQPLGRTRIALSSDNSTAANRTFVLRGGANASTNQVLVLEWTDTDAGELVDDSACNGSGNHRLNGTWTPSQYDTIILRFNGTDWIELGRGSAGSSAFIRDNSGIGTNTDFYGIIESAGTNRLGNLAVTNRITQKIVTLTYAGVTNVTIDLSQGNIFALTATNNAKFWPTNGPGAGWSQQAIVYVDMDGTGGYSFYKDDVTTETNYTSLVFSNAANAKNTMWISSDRTGTNFQFLVNPDFKK